MKSFKYRIYPTKSQIKKLNSVINICRTVYNHILNENRLRKSNNDSILTFFDMCKSLIKLKESNHNIKLAHSQVLQDVCRRLDINFNTYFKTHKRGNSFPRFKGVGRYDSFTFPQIPSGCKISKDNKLSISKIGDIKIVLHRKLEGNAKRATIKRTPTGKWFVIFVCDTIHTKLPKNENHIGIDVGITTFATLSSGTKIENPKFFKCEENNISKQNKKISNCHDEKRKVKVKKVLARIHERTKWKRDNFAHQNSRKIVNEYGIISIEDLNINSILKTRFRNLIPYIQDVAWGTFLKFISFKAEWAGRKLNLINPAYTSQICSTCGNFEKMELSNSVFKCSECGLEINRDLNAAKNILALGTQCLEKS